MHHRCRTGLFAGLIIVLSLSPWGCGPATPPVVDMPPPAVTVSLPVVCKITDYDRYDGRIEPVKSVEVRARVRGHLIKIGFTDGTEVKEGDLLFEIDPRPYKAALDQAQADVASAKSRMDLAAAEYSRTSILASKGAASREELDVITGRKGVATADLAKAQASVDQAKLDLEFCKITAPISGKIGRALVTEGNLVNSGGGDTLLTTIVSVDPMYVYFNVDERSLIRYRSQRAKELGGSEKLPPVKDLKIPVFVAREGEEGYPHEGVIDFADNKVDPNTGTIRVRGELSNKKRLFDAGMRARVQVPADDPHEAILVTERAIGSDQGQKYLYVVDTNDVVRRRDVELGALMGGLRVIVKGLKPDEKVIVNGIQRVRPEMKVKPQLDQMPGQPAAPKAETSGR